MPDDDRTRDGIEEIAKEDEPVQEAVLETIIEEVKPVKAKSKAKTKAKPEIKITKEPVEPAKPVEPEPVVAVEEKLQILNLKN